MTTVLGQPHTFFPAPLPATVPELHAHWKLNAMHGAREGTVDPANVFKCRVLCVYPASGRDPSEPVNPDGTSTKVTQSTRLAMRIGSVDEWRSR